VRSFRRNGKLTSKVCTFGAQANKRNYAIPCVDLRWDGTSWVGTANGYGWAGGGGDVMGALRLDIDQTLGYDAYNASLQCRLTVDDAEDPHEVLWPIVKTDGRAVVNIRLAPGGEAFGRSPVKSVSAAGFENLVQTGAWSFSDPSIHSDLRWIVLAGKARLALGFQTRRFRKNGRHTPRRYTFGEHANKAHYATPCADLRWDGRSWVGNVIFEVWGGSDGAVSHGRSSGRHRAALEQRESGGCVVAASKYDCSPPDGKVQGDC